MKKLIQFAAAILVISIAADGSTQTVLPGSAVDLVLRYGSCWTRELDTAKGKFTGDMANPSTTIDLRLTDVEMAEIEKQLNDMDFWNLEKFPAILRPPANNSGLGCGHAPSSPIFIRVTRGSMVREVLWDDVPCAPTREAQALRDLERLIRGMIEAKPEYRQMLSDRRGCA
jgi:hypothetical protein